jgi:hypothetical protein
MVKTSLSLIEIKKVIGGITVDINLYISSRATISIYIKIIFI